VSPRVGASVRADVNVFSYLNGWALPQSVVGNVDEHTSDIRGAQTCIAVTNLAIAEVFRSRRR
jgi:hypothetical protein